jgi:hypothetical protein
MRPSEALILDVRRHLEKDPDFRIGLTYIINADRSSGYDRGISLSELASAYRLPTQFETTWHKEALSHFPPQRDPDRELQSLRYMTEKVFPREISRVVDELIAEQKKFTLENSPYMIEFKGQSDFVKLAMKYLLNRHPNAADHLKSVHFDSSLISVWSQLILLSAWRKLFEGLLEDAELGRKLDLRILKDSLVAAMNHHFELNPVAITSAELKSTIMLTYRFPKLIEDTFSSSFHKAVDSMNKKFVRQGGEKLIVTKPKN